MIDMHGQPVLIQAVSPLITRLQNPSVQITKGTIDLPIENVNGRVDGEAAAIVPLNSWDLRDPWDGWDLWLSPERDRQLMSTS